MTAIVNETTRLGTTTTEFSRTRLTLGLLGRAWLWFLAASVALSLIPFFFGWSSFAIVTGSMEPGISAGDIVVTSPEFDADDLLGRVITFEDPAIPGHVLTHRVIAINGDGTLTTRGDANPTPDSSRVETDSILGMGRLLIRFIGLPVVWFITGNWLFLSLFIASLVGSVAAVVRDHEPAEPRREHRRIPSISGLFVVALAASVAIAGFAHQPASAAFSATTTNEASVWQLANVSYTESIVDLGPYLYWKLDETGGTTAADASGNGRTGTYNPGGGNGNFTRLADGALPNNDPNRAVRLNSNNACITTTSNSSITSPQVFTVVAWFRAPSSYQDGGKIIGFENPRTGVLTPGSGGSYDRQLYMDGQGRIWFGVYNGAHITLSSTTGLNDGAWHMAVGTMSASGMRLYIDGALVGSNSNSAGENKSGWWRAGCGNLSGWGNDWGGPNNPGTNANSTQNRVFRADLDEVTVFTSALSADQVDDLYEAR